MCLKITELFSFSDLLKGIDHLKKEIAKERQLSNDVHRDNLYSLINCVDSLNSLQKLIEKDAKDHNWPLTGEATKLVDTANQTADNLFSDVLGRKDRADSTRNALSVLTRFKFIFFLTKSIDENLQQVSNLVNLLREHYFRVTMQPF
jgi:exocyst complex component 2